MRSSKPSASMAVDGESTYGYTIAATLKGSAACKGATPSARCPGLGGVLVEKPAKAPLHRFALVAAGGYTRRDPHVAFTTHFLECFGWRDGHPDGVEKAK